MTQDKPTLGHRPNTKTIYAVVIRNRVQATGSLNQCWLYLFNTFPHGMSVSELTKRGVYIAPRKRI